MRRKYRINIRRESEELMEMRESGLPWLAASLILVVFLLSSIIVVIFLNKSGSFPPDEQEDLVVFLHEDTNQTDIIMTKLESRLPLIDETTDYNSEEESEEGEREDEQRQSMEREENADREREGEEIEGSAASPTTFPSHSQLFSEWPNGKNESIKMDFSRVVVMCPNEKCSQIGKNILLRGGNAVDASIGVEICLSALESHLSGLGGGMMGTVYMSESRECISINGRETSPQSITEQTYKNNPIGRKIGYSSISVPGVLHSLWKMYKQYSSGNISWMELIQPTIDQLQHGYTVSDGLAETLNTVKMQIKDQPALRRLYFSSTGEVAKAGDILIDFIYAETLRKIGTSRDPSQLFYRGDIANQIVKEMKENGGFIQKGDLVNYESELVPSLSTILPSKSSICGPIPPSIFALSQSIINTVQDHFNGTDPSDIQPNHFYHVFMEAQKFTFPFLNRFGDPKFLPSSIEFAKNLTSPAFASFISKKITNYVKVPDYYGKRVDMNMDSSNSFINIIDGEGNAVSISSTLNSKFGSLRKSEKLGIIWNNGMNGFTENEKENDNGIEPRKRAITMMSPVIVVNREKEQLLSLSPTGSSLSSVCSLSQLILSHQLFGMDLQTSSNLPRIWTTAHTGSQFEIHLPFKLASSISSHGHNLSPIPFIDPIHAIQSIKGGGVTAVCDWRKLDNCKVDGY